MDQASDDRDVKVWPIGSRPGPNRTTEHEYEIEGADLNTVEGYWAAVNIIRERLYRGHA